MELRPERVYKVGKTAGLILLALAFIYFLRNLPFEEYALDLLEQIQSWGPLAPVACVVVYVVWVLLLLPGSVMTIAAGVLFGTWGIAVAVAGGLAASSAAFLIARRLPLQRLRRWAAENENARTLNEALRQSGWVVVFLARLSPVIPYNITNYFFGITRVRFWTYFTATLVGMLPATALYAYAGSLGHRVLSGEEKVGPIHYILLGLGVLATAILAFSLKQKLQRTAEPPDERSN